MKTILFCGGGSAGHVIPNIAIIEELREDFNCLYIASNSTNVTRPNLCAAKFYAICRCLLSLFPQNAARAKLSTRSSPTLSFQRAVTPASRPFWRLKSEIFP